jgi:hypothetical protein
MATSFSTVYDYFMLIVDDYTLINLYNTNVTDFETYLSGFLIRAIGDFDTCNQSLVYSNTSFTATLTQTNINILAYLMKKYWLERVIDDIKQMNMMITDHDFKRFSESQNMTSKLNRYREMKEEVSQKLLEYGYKNNDWASWINGTFWSG